MKSCLSHTKRYARPLGAMLSLALQRFWSDAPLETSSNSRAIEKKAYVAKVTTVHCHNELGTAALRLMEKSTLHYTV